MEEVKYAINVHDLTVAYDYKPVLWDIHLQVPEGVLMALVGPNGAGKSTLIKAMYLSHRKRGRVQRKYHGVYRQQ